MPASSPFDDPSADIILRSSDNVDFFIVRKILSLASPFFQGMFDLPQPADSSKGIPVVDVQEESSTVDKLLRYCYPGKDPKIEEVDDLHNVLRMADKYEVVGVVERLETQYVSLGEINAKPLQAFALACRYKWRTVAQLAAKESLFFSVDELFQQAASADLHQVSAQQYNKLFQYHRKCRVACQRVCKSGCFEQPVTFSTAHRCKTRIINGSKWPVWWIHYMERVGGNFMNGPIYPILAKVGELRPMIDAARSTCIECDDSESVIVAVLKFIAAFEGSITETIASIPVDTAD